MQIPLDKRPAKVVFKKNMLQRQGFLLSKYDEFFVFAEYLHILFGYQNDAILCVLFPTETTRGTA